MVGCDLFLISRACELSMNFRADIEGLRGIAVLAVVLFHFKLGIAPAAIRAWMYFLYCPDF